MNRIAHVWVAVFVLGLSGAAMADDGDGTVFLKNENPYSCAGTGSMQPSTGKGGGYAYSPDVEDALFPHFEMEFGAVRNFDKSEGEDVVKCRYRRLGTSRWETASKSLCQVDSEEKLRAKVCGLSDSCSIEVSRDLRSAMDQPIDKCAYVVFDNHRALPDDHGNVRRTAIGQPNLCDRSRFAEEQAKVCNGKGKNCYIARTAVATTAGAKTATMELEGMTEEQGKCIRRQYSEVLDTLADANCKIAPDQISDRIKGKKLRFTLISDESRTLPAQDFRPDYQFNDEDNSVEFTARWDGSQCHIVKTVDLFELVDPEPAKALRDYMEMATTVDLVFDWTSEQQRSSPDWDFGRDVRVALGEETPKPLRFPAKNDGDRIPSNSERVAIADAYALDGAPGGAAGSGKSSPPRPLLARALFNSTLGQAAVLARVFPEGR